MNCPEVEELLSGYFDDEIAPDSRATVRSHIEGCPTCAGHLEEFQRLAALSAGLDDPAAPSHLWSDLERGLGAGEVDGSARPVSATRSTAWSESIGRWAAIAAVLVIGVGSLAYQSLSSTPHDERMANMDRYLDQFSENPDAALKNLSARYKTQTVDLEGAAQLVGFQPVAARRLPRGYSLDTFQVLDMGCCTCTQATYKSDDSDTLVLIEHGPDEPACLGNRPMVNCRCDGKPTSIVQVGDRIAASWKADKRYVTLVGARDLEQVTELMAYLNTSDRDE